MSWAKNETPISLRGVTQEAGVAGEFYKNVLQDSASVLLIASEIEQEGEGPISPARSLFTFDS
jgi:hypothetical protein